MAGASEPVNAMIGLRAARKRLATPERRLVWDSHAGAWELDQPRMMSGASGGEEERPHPVEMAGTPGMKTW